jgi:6-phosphogluconolactonase
VLPDHPDSNYRMAFETLLSKAPVPEENIHRIEGEEKPEIAAAKYEKAIRDFFQLADSELPRFDLILLGLGDDGHTASLFPGSEALQETSRLAVATYVEKLKSHRVTLTLPVLNHAANIFFLVAGENKTGILKDVLQRESSKSLPARQIHPLNGRLVWFVDRAADASLQS